jgi:hypothetical protein
MKGAVKKKTLAARLGEAFFLDSPLHRTKAFSSSKLSRSAFMKIKL